MRQILPSAKAYLTNNSKIRLAYLISLELPESTAGNAVYAYMTDYMRDITYGGVVFTSGKVKTISSHKQSRTLTVGSLNFTLTGTDSNEVIKLVQSGISFLDRSISIYQAIIDDNGNILPVDPDSNGPLLFFRGKIVGGGIKDSVAPSGVSTSTITWNCSNEFYDFERVNGRFTDDASHRGLEIVNGALVPSDGAKRREYRDDFGFFHANKSINILAQYQVKEERYKLESKKKFFGLSKSYSLKKYYETVTKEVDMDFNLTAKFLPVVYGVQKIPGIPVFIDTEKNNPNVVYAVYAFCEGEIEGFLDFQFGDAPMICLDSNDTQARTCFGVKRIAGDTMARLATGQASSSVTTHGQEYKYNDGNGDIRIWTYHGKSDQSAAQVLVDIAKANNFYLQGSQGAEYYDERFRLLDTAYAVIRYTITEDRTDLPEVSAEVCGRKIKVYATDGSVKADATSLNGIWQTYDYLTSSIFGAGLLADRMVLSDWIKEAALLDAQDTSYDVSWQPFWRYVGWKSAVGNQKAIMQMNTIVDTSSSTFKCIQDLLDSYQGALNNLSGYFRVTVEKDSKSPIEINFLDTYGDLDLSDTTGRNKYNSVQASIIDPTMNWKTNAITFYNSKFKEQDKGVDKKLQLSFSNITNYYTARSLADRELKKSRYSRSLSFSLPYRYLGIEPNDPIAFTYDRYGWNKKFFLVEEVENTRNGKINVTLQEYGDDVFINSGQVDNSNENVPIITDNVLPPRDFKYTPTPGGMVGDVGKNGELSWLPSLTTNVVYYSIRQSGAVDPYIVQQNSFTPTVRMIQDIVGQPAGLTIFEIRAVDINGRRSSPVTISVDLNAAKNLSMVENFRVLNLAPDPAEWVGADLELGWDKLQEEALMQGIFYTLEIRDNTNKLLRSAKISNLYNYSYLLAYNKLDYKAANSNTLGIYRALQPRIQAEGPKGEKSVAWAYI